MADDIRNAVFCYQGGNPVRFVALETNGGSREMLKSVDTQEIQAAQEFLSKKKGSIDPGDHSQKALKELMAFMEAIAVKDYVTADAAVEQLVESSEGGLYKEVGKVTRRLHDSLRSFKDAIDPKITSIVKKDMPSAVDRLQYCVQKTEEAANKTMSIVEKHMASMGELEENIQKLEGPDVAVDYLNEFRERYENDLTEIITAQSFQDLTGQTIQKVILLVADIEKELVGMVTAFGLKLEGAGKEEIHEKVNQGEVDDLLKELGF